MSINRTKNIAITGASGHVGRHIAAALLSNPQFTVTALVRPESNPSLPSGIRTAAIDYADPPSLVRALQGQDALVITLAGNVPVTTQSKLVAAAASAGVPWVLPNEWCPDLGDEGLVHDVPWFGKKKAQREEIAATGVCGYVALATGFWYEWMLALPAAYGFDFAKRKVTMFGEGNVRISQSTWPFVGKAVERLLSLPVEAEGPDGERCLKAFRNRAVTVSSFAVSQRQMLESVLRVTGTTEGDWTISKQSAEERYKQGFDAIASGNWAEAAKVSARIFYPDGCGYAEDRTVNKLLGLEHEDLDEATKIAIERSKAPFA